MVKAAVAQSALTLMVVGPQGLITAAVVVAPVLVTTLLLVVHERQA